MKTLKKLQNIKTYYLITSFFFAIIFSLYFIKLSLINYDLNGFLNYPSNTSVNSIFNTHDLTMIFSWARRAVENLSIFNLGSNLSGIEDKYHHFSSRGLGLFIFGSSMYLFDEPIYAITIIYFFFGFLNFYLIINYYKKFNFILSLFLTCLTITFASKAFGGVLNPSHYLEYLIREFENLKTYNSFQHSIYTALYRVPNILINNVFIFMGFYSIKKFDGKIYNLKTLFLFILIALSTIIDPLIFLVIGLFFFLKILIQLLKKKISKKNFFILFIFLILISISLIFHYQNYLIGFDNNEKHGVGLGNFWTGNYLFSFEMIIFPLLLYFLLNKDEKKLYYEETLFLISLLIIFCSLFLVNEILASRITNRNFEIIIACISYLFLFNYFKDFNKRKILITSIFFFLHFPYVYLLAGKSLFLNYIIVLIFIIGFCFFIKLFKSKKILTILSVFFVVIFFISLLLKDINRDAKIVNNEIYQNKFFHWLLLDNKKKNLISLNLGLLLNSELHTNKNVFISNITNVPSQIDRSFLLKRLNNIFYLYGFTTVDLMEFLKDYTTEWELNIDNFNPHKKNLAILNKIIFYENFQINYNKNQPIDILIDSYENFLEEKNTKKFKENFDTCIITNYDNKYIKENSFFSEIKKNEPIYINNFIRAYNC